MAPRKTSGKGPAALDPSARFKKLATEMFAGLDLSGDIQRCEEFTATSRKVVYFDEANGLVKTFYGLNKNAPRVTKAKRTSTGTVKREGEAAQEEEDAAPVPETNEENTPPRPKRGRPSTGAAAGTRTTRAATRAAKQEELDEFNQQFGNLDVESVMDHESEVTHISPRSTPDFPVASTSRM